MQAPPRGMQACLLGGHVSGGRDGTGPPLIKRGTLAYPSPPPLSRPLKKVRREGRQAPTPPPPKALIQAALSVESDAPSLCTLGSREGALMP